MELKKAKIGGLVERLREREKEGLNRRTYPRNSFQGKYGGGGEVFTCLELQPLPFVSICNVDDGKERCQKNAEAGQCIKDDPAKLADLNCTQDFCFAIHWRKAI